ncbi:ABC transporter substrate-binding protein [Candidatus Peregrinibacteria bacterium]|jgi:branched-chain amino acid transport system substrate-binding protein|nr:ABC transporter substrate-binding protein [Candidatus Peregrinibacteria bacterium]MBT3598394.1 ABC transporter substrate-binding protein [Candidatus Peregrinibacteria bacterium]MBT4367431.1 ABC transporter substrate-binding protein [Candidatus Peregrinibacteria bacterium]MBT4585665.1 ABC transporter substrate-binding protein [Candidatus Peregrinibacteria bacterium]MBT6730431.1 ABC transporter substrate-binding protein [Candidatus Peregrinibacteria bacterium]
MNTKHLLLLSISIIICGCSSARKDEPVRIGYIGPLTGDAVSYGTDTLHAVELAIAEANENGGINGTNIELIAQDGRCNSAEALSAATALLDVYNVDTIIGGNCSTETLAAAVKAESSETVLLAPLSSSPAVTDAGDFVFRMYPSGKLIGKIYAKYFEDNGYKNIAILSEDTDFCRGLTNAVKADLPEGANAVFFEAVKPGTKDFRSLISRMQSIEDVDVVMIAMQSDSAIAESYMQLREINEDVPVIANDLAESFSMAEIAGESLDGMDIIAVASPIPDHARTEHFMQSFVNKYGLPMQNYSNPALAYDATSLIISIMTEVGTDGEAMRDALYNLEGFDGIMGNISFDDNGDVIGVDYGLKQWKGAVVEDVSRIPIN